MFNREFEILNQVYNIRIISINELKNVAEIEKTGGKYYNIKSIEKIKDTLNNGIIFGVYNSKNKLIAEKQFYYKHPVCESDGVYLSGTVVLPEFRGIGLNKIFTTTVIEYLKQKKTSNISCVVHPFNIRSIKGLLQFGFKIVRFLPNHYSNSITGQRFKALNILNKKNHIYSKNEIPTLNFSNKRYLSIPCTNYKTLNKLFDKSFCIVGVIENKQNSHTSFNNKSNLKSKYILEKCI